MAYVFTCVVLVLYHYKPKTKQESAARKNLQSSPQKKIYQTKSIGKVILIFFFYECEIIYWYVVPSTSQGQKWTINSKYYCEVLKTLFTYIAEKRLELKKKFLLHPDNACPHTSSKMLVFLTKHRIEDMEHPPYRPPLTLCNFWLFPCLKSVLRESIFDTNEAVVAANSRFNSIDWSKFAKTWVKWRDR